MKLRNLVLLLVIFSFFSFNVIAEDIYVSPSGSIQAAFDQAMPGDTIHLNDGTYYESFVTVRDGTVDSPITLKGGSNAIVKGDGNGRMIQINHDNIHFEGFTVDGLNGDPNYQYAYTDKLIYVQGKGVRDGVDNLKITGMTIKNSGGEALRLRYFIKNAEIAHNTFLNTGMHDFKFNDGGKNGEAIYLGTSSNQWADGKNPTADPDESTGNWIHHNYFDTQGNECVDIKEGSHNNIVEYNICTGQKDPNSAGLDSRGNNNIFRYNQVFGCVGAGVRLGGHNIDGQQYGVDNHVYGNDIHDNQYGAVKTMVLPQLDFCDNQLTGNGAGYGNYLLDMDVACSDDVTGGSDNLENGTNEEPSNEPETDNNSDGNTEFITTPSGTQYALTTSDVSSTSDDGNVAENTLDGDFGTRWSAEGDGEYIEYNLGDLVFVKEIGIAFYKGDSRIQYFDVETSNDGINWESIYSGTSNGFTNDMQYYLIDIDSRYLRIIGHGNTENLWNSFTEVSFFIEDNLDNSDTNENTSEENNNTNTETEDQTEETIVTVNGFSSDDGNVAENTIDGDLDSRWSAEGEGEYIEYDLGDLVFVKEIGIAFYKGDSRVQYFDVETSTEGDSWDTIYSGESSGYTNEIQNFNIESEAKYLRIVGHGNTENLWNSLTEVEFIIESFISSEEENTSGVIDSDNTVDDSSDNATTGSEDDSLEISLTVNDYSSDDGNVAENTLDGDLGTRWSAEGDGEFIEYDLGKLAFVEKLAIAFYKGDSRVQYFDVEVSADGENWNVILSAKSNGSTNELQYFQVNSEAKFIRIVGHENDENAWNSLTEVEVVI